MFAFLQSYSWGGIKVHVCILEQMIASLLKYVFLGVKMVFHFFNLWLFCIQSIKRQRCYGSNIYYIWPIHTAIYMWCSIKSDCKLAGRWLENSFVQETAAKNNYNDVLHSA